MSRINSLSKLLNSKDKDIVKSPTDRTFDEAVDMSPDEFRKKFDKRCKSHSGFSPRVSDLKRSRTN